MLSVLPTMTNVFPLGLNVPPLMMRLRAWTIRRFTSGDAKVPEDRVTVPHEFEKPWFTVVVTVLLYPALKLTVANALDGLISQSHAVFDVPSNTMSSPDAGVCPCDQFPGVEAFPSADPFVQVFTTIRQSSLTGRRASAARTPKHTAMADQQIIHASQMSVLMPKGHQ